MIAPRQIDKDCLNCGHLVEIHDEDLSCKHPDCTCSGLMRPAIKRGGPEGDQLDKYKKY